MSAGRDWTKKKETSFMGISCFIVCCNEERNIRRCLESVAWCDEIIVIDSGSTDATLDICREFTDRIIHKAWSGYVNQKRFGLENCTEEWVLNIDADEEVSGPLKEEIMSMVGGTDARAGSYDGFYISRLVFYLGRWWRRGGWYPEYRLRLCRRSATEWGGNDPHEKAAVRGKTGYLQGELYHYTYTCVDDQVSRLNSHSRSAALSLHKKGERPSLAKTIVNPLVRFLKSYVLKRGFLEGYAGLAVAGLEAWYVFVKYVKLWEIEQKAEREKEESTGASLPLD